MSLRDANRRDGLPSPRPARASGERRRQTRPGARRRTLVWAALGGLLVALASAAPARAHVVARGVGTQSELTLSPRRLVLKFNLGFSNLLGLGQFKLMDSNEDGEIDRDEEARYLAALIQRIQPQLRLSVDGKPVQLEVLERKGLGIVGGIESVGFDTWYVLAADVDLGAGPHELRYRDGTFAGGGDSEQLLWIPDGATGFASFVAEQGQRAGPPTQPRGGVRGLRGRDVTLRFAFSDEALKDDAVLAALEPRLAGLETAARAWQSELGEELASELNDGSFRGLRFGSDSVTGFSAGAPMAEDRVVEVESGGTVSKPGSTGEAKPAAGSETSTALGELGEKASASRMVQALQLPGFSLVVLLWFFAWGMLHALAPGHGKTMVAAYLLGTEGRLSDAFKLGTIVTITHTITLYTVGLLIVWLVTASEWTTFLRQTAQHLTLLSGVGLVAYGLFLAQQRWKVVAAAKAVRDEQAAERGLAEPGEGNADTHEHDHAAAEGHDHAHEHDPAAAGDEHAHEHDHAAAEGHEHAHEHDHAAEEGHDHAHEHAAAGHDHAHDHAAAGHDHAHDHAAAGHDHAHDHSVAGHDHAHDHSVAGHNHDHAAAGHNHDHAAAGHDPAHAHDHAAAGHDHAHDHAAEGHGHGHTHDHTHDHAHMSAAEGHGHGHTHDHAHMSDAEHALAHARDAASVTSFRDLLVLGGTGGLVPCPAGVTLVIFSLSLKGQNTLKCFVYLTAFSLGLAGVLVAIASLMVITRRYLFTPDENERHPLWLDALPLVSCLGLVLVGIYLCARAFMPELDAAQTSLFGDL